MENNIDSKMLENYILKIANDDLMALEMLYNDTRNFVFRFALSMLNNQHDAEDVMQDVYVNINRYAGKYDPRNKPMAWILTMTKNLCLNKIKNNQKRNALDITEIEEIIGNKDDSAFNKLLIKNIVLELEDEERQIFILNTIDDFKFREIADLLNLKLSTVLSKYHRAMKKIRALYKDGVK